MDKNQLPKLLKVEILLDGNSDVLGNHGPSIIRDLMNAVFTDNQHLAKLIICDVSLVNPDYNPLQHELLDLIKLMPDTQTQEIIDFIMEMRAIRKKRDE